MLPKKQGKIALISVHGDPAIKIAKEEVDGHNVYVRQIGEVLTRQGWQVDMFTRKTDARQASIGQHTPGCQTIRLTASPEEIIGRDYLYQYLPEFVELFLSQSAA